ncbi:ABC transporter substrate-binding protein, putative [Babesia ovata]|uniref:ABC transporter substrate-binding protein, putative n=1 Tax=Babesia ovata TaxID=189622 RepID=A0A2H6KIL6_9APIC|nr:ABC transporter substrate-binding protein, putative [Babesia ovata]GBE62828.1 ABC transporter substrate-binding protein, putative [Babesia ovata]
MPDSTAQGDEMMLDVIDVPGFYGLDVFGDFLNTIYICFVLRPVVSAVIKAMLSQLLQLIGDLFTQLLLELCKLTDDVLDASLNYTGLRGQRILLTLKFSINF